MLPDFTKCRVLVVGDLMLDRYWSGDTRRVSPEAPVPVVTVTNETLKPGGAGNVAMNIAALGAHVGLMGICGTDKEGALLEATLASEDVNCYFLTLESAPTITKLRVISRHQQLIRLDFEDSFGDWNMESFVTEYKQLLDQTDLVVLSDYNKGCLKNPRLLIDIAAANNTPVLVDPKGDSFDKYRDATLLTPNLSEFEAIVGHCDNEDTLAKKAEILRQKLNLRALVITRGADGISVIEKNKKPLHLTTEAQDVFDVTGAGDTVIATLAAAIACGCSTSEALNFANHAAGLVVGKLGTATVSINELESSLGKVDINASGIVTHQQLLALTAEARVNGKKVVMTNGCFDLLHPGHLQYLREAKALGDHLIVAVNDDVSVTQLKGPQRPINTLSDRMEMLAGLASTDWITSFSDDTPEKLIATIKPDYLVKGGDYKPEEVAGGDAVRQNGGQVVILQFLDGYSSTDLVNRIQQ